VLIGKTGVGKSSTANTLMGGRRYFRAEASVNSITSDCDCNTYINGSMSYKIVDTPGFMDTGADQNEIRKEIAASLQLATPGPHVFLIVLKFNRFTKADEDVIFEIKKLFGERFTSFAILLFTNGDAIKHDMNDDFSEEEYRQECEKLFSEAVKTRPVIAKLLEQFSGRMFVIDNRSKDKKAEASRLYNAIHEWGLGTNFCSDKHRLAEIMKEEENEMIERKKKEEQDRKNEAERKRLIREDEEIKQKVHDVEEFKEDLAVKTHKMKNLELEFNRSVQLKQKVLQSRAEELHGHSTYKETFKVPNF
ncbi:unnamed protein product, partial [Owenia fusiformis]